MPDAGTYAWPPRGMPERAAAYYVGLSPSTFRAQVAPHVRGVRATTGRVIWLREDLDAWLDRQAGKVVDAAPGTPQPAGEPQGSAPHDAIAESLAALRPAKGRPRRPRPQG